MSSLNVERCPSFISSQFAPGGERPASAGVRRAVTISRQAGCGALAVAENLAAYLQARTPRDSQPWTIFDRNLMDRILEEHGLPAYLARFLPEDRVSEIEDLVAELLGAHPPQSEVVQHSVETILRLAAMGNVILIGRGSNFITARLPRVFHVRLVAPFERRVAHCCEAYGMTEAEARAFCRREDAGRERYVRKYFNADIADPLNYHMIINTGQISYDDAAQIIGDTVLKMN